VFNTDGTLRSATAAETLREGGDIQIRESLRPLTPGPTL